MPLATPGSALFLSTPTLSTPLVLADSAFCFCCWLCFYFCALCFVLFLLCLNPLTVSQVTRSRLWFLCSTLHQHQHPPPTHETQQQTMSPSKLCVTLTFGWPLSLRPRCRCVQINSLTRERQKRERRERRRECERERVQCSTSQSCETWAKLIVLLAGEVSRTHKALLKWEKWLRQTWNTLDL